VHDATPILLLEMQLAEQFWGDYFGSLRDRYGTQ
jgi:uncharacterized glyoxalase superfamily protein PhnB